MPEIKAVLFDMDGVIYDSMPNHARTWHQAMADCGLEMAPELAYEWEGMRGVEVVRMLVSRQWSREVTEEEIVSIYRHKTELYSQCPPAPVMPGIMPLMQHLRDAGIKICVVTGSGQQSMLEKLVQDFHGLVTPGLMVTANDVLRGKPHPEPYLRGMQKCGTQPAETVVVENAPLGVRAAVAAGCMTIAVNTGPLPDGMLRHEGAACVLPSMSELSRRWEELLLA